MFRFFYCQVLLDSMPKRLIMFPRKNNSSFVSLGTNIYLKSRKIDPSSLSSNEFSVTGSASGTHLGRVKLSDDNKTILFFPATPFSPNENVSVQVNQGIKTTDGNTLHSTTIHFTTTPFRNG